MPDRRPPRGLDFEAEDARERLLWERLEGLEEASPGEGLRRGFYERLGAARHRQQRRQAWWNLLRNPLAPAFATLLLGLLLGRSLVPAAPAPEIQALRQEVQALNTQVALSLIDKPAAGDRLRAISLAEELAGKDPRLTRALLQRAAEDRSQSVRAAAVTALGQQLEDPTIAAEVERLLRTTESPLVQLALAELVMRWGDQRMLEGLLRSAERQELLPDVRAYVLKHVERVRA